MEIEDKEKLKKMFEDELEKIREEKKKYERSGGNLYDVEFTNGAYLSISFFYKKIKKAFDLN